MGIRDAIYEAVQERVTKGKKTHPAIHTKLALLTMLLVFLSMVSIIIVLFLVERPHAPPDIKTYDFTPDVDVASRLADCNSYKDVTSYPPEGRLVATVGGVGHVFVRRAIHPDEIANRSYGMLCTLPANFESQVETYIYFGVAGGSGPQANICLTPEENDTVWLNPVVAKSSKDSADLYVESTRDSVDQMCIMILTELDLIYRELVRSDPEGAALVGINCISKRPSPFFGEWHVPLIDLVLYFAWPMNKEKGVASFIVETPHFSKEQTHSFQSTMRQWFGHSGDPVEKMEKEGFVLPDQDAENGPARVMYSQAGGTYVLAGPYSEQMFANIFGYAVGDGKYASSASWNVSAAQTLLQFHLNGNPKLELIRRSCKNRTTPLKPNLDVLGDAQDIWEEALVSYRRTTFRYECRRVRQPTLMDRLSHIWPLVSICYTLLMAYAVKLVYKFTYTLGLRTGLLAADSGTSARDGDTSCGDDITDTAISDEVRLDEAEAVEELQDRVNSAMRSIELELRTRDEAIDALRKHVQRSEQQENETRDAEALLDVGEHRKEVLDVQSGSGGASSSTISPALLESIRNKLERLEARTHRP